MRILLLAALATPLLRAADVCPPGKSVQIGGAPESLWQSYTAEVHPGKFCISNEIRNLTAAAAEVLWPEAGIQRATVAGDLQIARCCFDRVETAKSKLRVGASEIEAVLARPAEEGAAGHQEGFPDLIEEDARVRIVSIRGTVSAGGQPLQIDVVLKCTASQFAKQYAYQYSLADRSPDSIDVEWDLVNRMRRVATPSMQTMAGTKTWLFIRSLAPREVVGRVTIRSKAGAIAGVFQLDGFTVN